MTGLGGARAKVALRETHEVPPCLRRFDLPCRGLFEIYSLAPPEGKATPASAPPVLPPAPSGPFNVVLITIDSLRADMPWAGYPRDIAPRLTELEKASVSFTHAYSISSFTSKSVGGLLGGEYPSAMTRDGVFFTRYFDDNLMFPERLRAGGIRTLSGHAAHVLSIGGEVSSRGSTITA